MVTSVCLIVIGIVGQWCYGPATPIGECVEMNYDQHLCVVEAEHLPIFASIYDYAICDEYPINCFGDGSAFANGIATGPEWYEVAAACPFDWVGSYVTIPEIYDHPLYCTDTGGRVHPQFRLVNIFSPDGVRSVWMWVIIIDILYPYHLHGWPPYALQVYPQWTRTTHD